MCVCVKLDYTVCVFVCICGLVYGVDTHIQGCMICAVNTKINYDDGGLLQKQHMRSFVEM